MKKILYILVIVIVFIATFKLLSKQPESSQDNSSVQQSIDNPNFVFYYGITCPHCKVVEEFIAENQLAEKLKIDFKEVYEVPKNQQEFSANIQKYCPDLIDRASGGIGVPVIFNTQQQTCLQGDIPIIDFLKEESQIND